MDRYFADIDEYGRGVGWDLDFHQLDAGALRARAAVLGTTRSVAIRVEFDRAFHQVGSPPPGGLTFGLPDPEVGEFRWCGARVHGGDLIGFNLPGGFEGTSGAGFSGYTLFFSDELVREVSEVLELDVQPDKSFHAAAPITRNQRVTEPLLRRLTAAFRSLRGGRPFNDPAAAELFRFSAAATILCTLSSPARWPVSASGRRRSKAVRDSLELLDAMPKRAWTVSELCLRTGVSAASLYRGFTDEFGVGPKQYVQARRLGGARRELTASAPEVRVADVANSWGFWHLGQFAADYRRHFGELPSDTLRHTQSSSGRPIAMGSPSPS